MSEAFDHLPELTLKREISELTSMIAKNKAEIARIERENEAIKESLALMKNSLEKKLAGAPKPPPSSA